MTDSWEFKDLSVAQSPAVIACLNYWRSKCQGAQLPSRAEIDPLEMRFFLAKILIIDIESDGAFTYRLCGTEITDANGKELTGQRASASCLGAAAPQFIDAYQRTIRAREPLFFIGQLWWQDRGHMVFEQILLPLSSDGVAVDKLLCVVDFEVPHVR